MRDRTEHVSFFIIPLIGLMLGFVATWLVMAVLITGSLVIYGFTGLVFGPPPFRVVAFIFSAVFVFVTGIGWASWAADAVRRFRASPTRRDGE